MADRSLSVCNHWTAIYFHKNPYFNMINHGCMICIKYDPWFTGTIHHIDWGRSRYLPMISHCDILTLVHWSLDHWARSAAHPIWPISSDISSNWLWEEVSVLMALGTAWPAPSRDNCAPPPTEIITRLHNERQARREADKKSIFTIGNLLQGSIFIHL